MSIYNVPALPRLLTNPFSPAHRTSIPAPSLAIFNAQFGAGFAGILPQPQTITSYWGTTTYYVVKATCKTPKSAEPRHMVIIHGAGTPAVSFLPLAHLLAAATDAPTTVLLFDSWGHGLSSTPLTAHVPGLFHFQLLHLLSHLRWPSVDLLGYSFGGIIAATFARWHPECVRSLVLVAPVGLMRRARWVPTRWAKFVEWGGWAGSWLASIRFWDRAAARRIYQMLGPGPIREGWEERFLRDGLDGIPRDAIQVWEAENHRGHMASLVSLYRYGGVYENDETYALLAKGELRILVLLGEKDGIILADDTQRELENLKWPGEIHVVSEVGHSVAAEKPREVANLIFRFWSEL